MREREVNFGLKFNFHYKNDLSQLAESPITNNIINLYLNKDKMNVQCITLGSSIDTVSFTPVYITGNS